VDTPSTDRHPGVPGRLQPTQLRGQSVTGRHVRPHRQPDDRQRARTSGSLASLSPALLAKMQAASLRWVS
jgi:hypothetical protein